MVIVTYSLIWTKPSCNLVYGWEQYSIQLFDLMVEYLPGPFMSTCRMPGAMKRQRVKAPKIGFRGRLHLEILAVASLNANNAFPFVQRSCFFRKVRARSYAPPPICPKNFFNYLRSNRLRCDRLMPQRWFCRKIAHMDKPAWRLNVGQVVDFCS